MHKGNLIPYVRKMLQRQIFSSTANWPQTTNKTNPEGVPNFSHTDMKYDSLEQTVVHRSVRIESLQEYKCKKLMSKIQSWQGQALNTTKVHTPSPKL